MTPSRQRWSLILAALAGLWLAVVTIAERDDDPPTPEDAAPAPGEAPTLVTGDGTTREDEPTDTTAVLVRAHIVDAASGTSVEGATLDAGAAGSAVSDEDGRVQFRCRADPGDTVHATVTCDGYEAQTLQQPVQEHEAQFERIALRRQLAFVGEVVDEDGAAAPRAHVELALHVNGRFKTSAATRADDAGRFRLEMPAGTTYLGATGRRLVAWAEDGRWGTAIEPGPGQVVRITLQPLHGTLHIEAPVWPDGIDPQPLALVVRTPDGPTKREGFSRVFDMAADQRELPLRLPRGEYEVVPTADTDRVELPERTGYLYKKEGRVKLRAFAIPENATWRVRVVDDVSGTPVAEAQVYFGPAWNEYTDDDGVMTRTFWHGTPKHTEDITVRHPQFERVKVTAPAGDVSVRLKRAKTPPAVHVLVRDAEGRARKDATFAWIHVQGDVHRTGVPEVRRSALPDSTHVIRPMWQEESEAPNLTGWRETYRAYRIDLAGHTSQVVPIDEVIAAFEARTTLEIQLGPRRTVRVHVVDELRRPVPNAEILVWSYDVHHGTGMRWGRQRADDQALSSPTGDAVLRVNAKRRLVIWARHADTGSCIAVVRADADMPPIVLRRHAVEGTAHVEGAKANRIVVFFTPQGVPKGLAHMFTTHVDADATGAFTHELPHGVAWRVWASASVRRAQYKAEVAPFVPGTGQTLDMTLVRGR